MQRPGRRFAATVSQTARGLAAVLLVLGTGCGPESTTATITAIEPLDGENAVFDPITVDDGIVRVEHRLFGCVPLSDLVQVTFDLPPSAHGLPRTGYRYLNGVPGEDWATLRSVVSGVGVGSTFPATVEVHNSGFGNGTNADIRIPVLDGRARAAMPPLGSRRCPGSHGGDDELE